MGMRTDPRPPSADTASAAGSPFSDENIDALCQQYRRSYRDASYYSSGRTWADYAPAYRYGFRSYAASGDCSFDEIEAQLARDWEPARDGSRLTWAEARRAVMAAWGRARSEARYPSSGAADEGGTSARG